MASLREALRAARGPSIVVFRGGSSNLQIAAETRPLRVLLMQRSLHSTGGANGVVAWMAQALVPDCAVTLLTWFPPDLQAVDRFYGTHLAGTPTASVLPPTAVRALLGRFPLSLPLLKNHLLMRIAKRLAREDRFDVLISGENETDFGRPGIQYVAYPHDHRTRADAAAHPSRLFGAALLAYWHLAHRISSFRDEGVRSNLTLACSSWSAARMKEAYGAASAVLYPPAPGHFEDVAWDQRFQSFACAGRVSRNKRYEDVIDILAAVRERVPAPAIPTLDLALIPIDEAYGRELRPLLERHRSWIRVHWNVERESLARLLSHSRYAIHGASDEPFGMAVSECLLAGTIPFARAGSGPVEVLGGDSRLLFSSREDATAKIGAVLSSSELQRELRAQLADRKPLFTAERFVERLRDLVREFASRGPNGGAPA